MSSVFIFSSLANNYGFNVTKIFDEKKIQKKKKNRNKERNDISVPAQCSDYVPSHTVYQGGRSAELTEIILKKMPGYIIHTYRLNTTGSYIF